MLSADAQNFADFEITMPNQGTGTFENGDLSNFTWTVTGTINGETQILDDEVFINGSQFENTFGQADLAENLRIRLIPNGLETIGEPISSSSTLTIDFDQTSPAEAWGFCVVDIDVENCLISAIDENDNEVAVEDINDWLIELFDADPLSGGVDIPKWDPTNAALLGSGTDISYVVYNNLVIGGIGDSEASAAFFMPDIPLKSLMVEVENLQHDASVSHHFYIASENTNGLNDIEVENFSVHPNPASSILTFQLKKPERCTLNVYDIKGKLIYTHQVDSQRQDIGVGTWPEGEYLLELISPGARSVKKIVILH